MLQEEHIKRNYSDRLAICDGSPHFRLERGDGSLRLPSPRSSRQDLRTAAGREESAKSTSTGTIKQLSTNRFAAHILRQHQFNALAIAYGWYNSFCGWKDNQKTSKRYGENRPHQLD
jgi:hypothetical protein